MCGIVGIHCKTDVLRDRLGALLVPMIDALTTRGPDSAGIAIYNHDAGGDWKYSLRAPGVGFDWEAFGERLSQHCSGPVAVRLRAADAVVVTEATPEAVAAFLDGSEPIISMVGHGRAIEVFKDVGAAGDVCERYGVGAMKGYQAVGHTRMATESAVTMAHSHPFAVAADLALVHNGSFSNHATIRRRLADEGIHCDTDNDSEVAARFLGAALDEGADLDKALTGVLETFDGFFTLLVATETSFAVVRDSFACKPMVIAECDDYVAVASEYMALADMPGIEDAQVTEPQPEELYSWTSDEC